MQPVTDTAASRSSAAPPTPGAPSRWKDALHGGAARKVARLLDSGAEALDSLEHALDEITSRDWTASGVATRVERAASEAVRRRAASVLSRLDHAPVAGIAYGVRLSRAAVQAARSALQDGSRRLSPLSAPTGDGAAPVAVVPKAREGVA